MKKKNIIPHIIIMLLIICHSTNAFPFISRVNFLPSQWGKNLYPGTSMPIMPSPHLEQETYLVYNSLPPTSGPHYEIPAEKKYNNKPIPWEIQVHELEHGAILLQYNCKDCKELVKKLARIAYDYDLVILAPFFGMNHKIAITAWGKIDLMDELDEISLRRFIIHYIYKGNPTSQCRGSLHKREKT